MGLRKNEVVDLLGGDKITLRNGDVLSYDDYYDKIVNTEDSRTNYNADLTHKHDRDLDIVKVERPTAYEVVFKDVEVRRGATSRDTEDDLDIIFDALKRLLSR